MSTLEAAQHHCSTTFQNDIIIRVWSYNCYPYKYPHKDSMKPWQRSRSYQLRASCICSCVFAISASKSSGKSTCPHLAIIEQISCHWCQKPYIFATLIEDAYGKIVLVMTIQVLTNYFTRPSKCSADLAELESTDLEAQTIIRLVEIRLHHLKPRR